MKNLLLILAILIIAPAITCTTQATFEQAFINMPLDGADKLGVHEPTGKNIGIGILISFSSMFAAAAGAFAGDEWIQMQSLFASGYLPAGRGGRGST